MAFTRKQTVIHVHGKVRDNITVSDLKLGEIVVLHPENGAPEFGTLNNSKDAIMWFKDYETTKTYVDDEIAKVSTRVTTLEGLTGKTASALQKITKGTDGEYVKTTIGDKSENQEQSLAVSVTVQTVSGASGTSKGLAEASDVKTYVDGKDSTLQGNIDAINNKLGTGFTSDSTVAAQLAAVKITADGAVQSVEGSDTVNAATNTDKKVTLSLKTSDNGNVKFTQDTDGLSANVTIPEATVTGVTTDDKVLSLTDKLVSATVSLEYGDAVSETLTGKKTIKLRGKDNAVISEIDASEFIKDGMLDSAALVTTAEEGVDIETPYIKLAFNTDAGKETIRFSVKDLVDTYTAAADGGLKLENHAFSVDTDKIATVEALNSAKTELEGSDTDTKDKDTIAGAKKYADSLKETVDAYTVNGKNISGNPTLGGNDINVGGDKTHKDDKLNVAIEELYEKVDAAAAGGVLSFGGKTGDITLAAAGTANGSVNLSMNENALGASIVGLGTAAYKNEEDFVATVTVNNTDTNKITATKSTTNNVTNVALNFDQMVIDCGEF